MRRVIQTTRELSENISSSLASVTMCCDNLMPQMESARKFANAITTSLPDYSKLFNDVLPPIAHFAELARGITSAVDFGLFVEAVRPVALRVQRVELLDRVGWPLYLVDSKSLCNELDVLTGDVSDDELRQSVSRIAAENLGLEWLKDTRACWAGHKELGVGKYALLSRALNRHESGDYEGCVALLMNLFEGLLNMYMPITKAPDEERKKLFDWHAEELGITSTDRKNGGARELVSAKDKVLLLVVCADDGWCALEHAMRYIVKVILTNEMDEEVAAHNPLRNKICHGIQTEYGTLEHSLKAILVTDIVIRYGAAALEGLRDLENKS